MARVAFAGLASGAHATATFPNSHLLAPVSGNAYPGVGSSSAAWAAPKAGGVLSEIREAVHDEDWAGNFSEGRTKIHMRAEWSASEDRCSFLAVLVGATQARKVLEIGSFCGVGTLALAEALPRDGEVLALELDPFVVNFGKRFQMKSSASTKIQHRVGPARDSLGKLANQAASSNLQAFDVAIVDADKENMQEYLRVLLDTPGLLSKSAVVCVDMTPFKGQPPLRYEKFKFPYRCEANSGQTEIDAVRSFVKQQANLASYEFGGLLIMYRK
eukprot:TRINITY_DN2492_c0_g1_i1.p1 TRINITY_DN2492_c0_g1~~TRINITY_DN2492_c0_g1_i1.p1  ORF type:complete len:272 (-),score=62.54 TRINITY_DN2492_c0_g1_i1:343-1158(-)